MRRARTIFAALAAISASLCVLTVFAGFRSHSRDISFEFTRHGARWELAFRSGRLGIDNQPQVRLETAEFDARTAHLRRRTHEVWGSVEWRRSNEEMDRLDREHAAVATSPIGHSVSLVPIIALQAVLPAIWSAFWLKRNPAKRRRLVKVSVTSVALFCVLLCPLSIAAWIRGHSAADVIGVPSTWHFYKAVLGNGGILLQSFRTYKRTQNVQFQISKAGGRSTIVTQPIGNPSDLPIPYSKTGYARMRGQDTLGPPPRKWDQLHWRTFTAADKITYQGYVWTQTKPRAYPWISHGELSFPAESFATVSATIRTQESDVFAGLDVWLPYWLIVAVTSIWPAIVLNAIRKSRRDSKRAASQLCTRCGYDLRATPLRCPECGKETEPKSST